MQIKVNKILFHIQNQIPCKLVMGTYTWQSASSNNTQDLTSFVPEFCFWLCFCFVFGSCCKQAKVGYREGAGKKKTIHMYFE